MARLPLYTHTHACKQYTFYIPNRSVTIFSLLNEAVQYKRENTEERH